MNSRRSGMTNVVILGGTEEARLVLRGLLRLHQHRVFGVSGSPDEALALLKEAPDPVLLLDIELQTKPWEEIVPEALRVQPRARVVLLAQSRSPRLEAQAKAAGVMALVRRPFAIHELLGAVAPADGGGTTSGPPPSGS